VSDLEDRAADVFEGLFMIADLAGGHWPSRARAAAKQLCDESADEQDVSLPVHLLHDLREVLTDFKADFAPTEILLQHLKQIKESPWAEMDLSGHRLAAMLRSFAIKSTRDTSGKKRGYRKTDFTDAFERYPATQASEPSESGNTVPDLRKQPDTSSDALSVPAKASDETSESLPRSTPTLTLSDTSDANTGEDCCRDCQRPQPEWILIERDGRCVRCDQDQRTGRSA
jgi:hypothetical protein